MRKLVWVLCPLVVLILAQPVSAQLACDVKADCGGELELFRISDTTNAHAELYTGTGGYTSKVCCSPGDELGRDCGKVAGPEGDTVLWLSDITNAHVSTIGYGQQLCLSGYGTVECKYEDTTACSEDYECVVSISGDDNAHVADCGADAYTTKVCCKFTPAECVFDIDCDDGLECTEDTCVDGTAAAYCENVPLHCGKACPETIGDYLCDGLGNCLAGSCTQLNCDPPSGERYWGPNSDCGRAATFKLTEAGIKYVCEGSLDSCTIGGEATPLTGSFTISDYPSGNYREGEEFTISLTGLSIDPSGFTPLIECEVQRPEQDGTKFHFDNWGTEDVDFTYTITGDDPKGEWQVNYCGMYSDFYANGGWNIFKDDMVYEFNVLDDTPPVSTLDPPEGEHLGGRVWRYTIESAETESVVDRARYKVCEWGGESLGRPICQLPPVDPEAGFHDSAQQTSPPPTQDLTESLADPPWVSFDFPAEPPAQDVEFKYTVDFSVLGTGTYFTKGGARNPSDKWEGEGEDWTTPVVDMTPPATSISPDGGDDTDAIPFTITCTDDYSGCAQINYKIVESDFNCADLATEDYIISVSPVQAEVDCATGQECWKKVCFYGIDNAAVPNEESPKASPGIFHVDRTGANAWIVGVEPVFLSGETGKNYTNTTLFNVSWAALGSVLRFDVAYRVEDEACPGEASPAGTDWCKWGTYPGDKTWAYFGPYLPGTIVDVVDGKTYKFMVQATDMGGNLGEWSSEYDVTVDMTAPTCSLFGLDPISPPDFTLDWSIDDSDGSGVETGRIEYSTDEDMAVWDDAYCTILGCFDFFNPPASNQFTPERVAFRCRVTDYADNVGDWSDIAQTITVTEAPSATQIIKPDAAWQNSGTFDVEWAAFGAESYTVYWNSTGNPAWAILADEDGDLDHTTKTSAIFRGGVDGTTYCFKVVARNIVGGSESEAVCTTVDTQKPSVEVKAYRVIDGVQEALPLGKIAAAYLGQLNITSEASDPSGIGENIIEYLLVQGGVSYPLRSKVCYAESLCSFELGELITVDPDTVLQYRARAADNAGNENVSDNGKWRFLTDHPLANFVTKSLILTMGSSYLAKVHVRNLLDEADTITINLEGYQYAEFLPYQEGGVVNDIPGRKNGQLVVEDLEPGDTREFSIKILSSEPRVDTLNLTATSTVEPTLDDKHGVTIRTEYPPEFPGLAEWAVVMLVLLSGGVYFWKVRV